MPGDSFEIDEEAAAMGRRSPSESGQARWATNEAIATSFNDRDPTTWLFKKPLARLENAKPLPVALHVRVGASGNPTDFDFVVGAPNLNNGGGFALILTYGDLFGRHTLVADLRSGIYQLPACTFVEAWAIMWSTAGLGTALQVDAALSRQLCPQPKPFTVSASGDLAAAGSVTILVPAYAQFVDIWATPQNSPDWNGDIGGANAPVLTAKSLGLHRDYTTGLFVPPWGPASYCGDQASNDSFALENAGTGQVRAFVQFYLFP